MSLAASMYIRFLYQEMKVKGKRLLDMLKEKGFPDLFDPRSVRRHAKKAMFDQTNDKRKYNKGRPVKITARDTRKLIQTLRDEIVEYESSH